jgi:3-oxoacyl-[acyl-carrier-protein] synthase-3
MSRTAVIVGTGSYAPNNVVTNEDIIKRFEDLPFPDGKGGTIPGRTFLEKLADKVGYKKRHKMKDPEETTATMCVKAGKKALEDAGLKPEDLDMIILATDSPDFISPPTSARIQYELGAVNASFFDTNAACAGFTIALTTGWNFIQGQKELKHIMVIGGYGMSRYSDPNDPVTELMFADGAGALILRGEEDTEYGIKSASMKGDGKYWDYMGIYAGGTWKGFEQDAFDKKLQYVKFLKQFPATVNIEAWPGLIEKTLDKAGWTKDDVDKMFFTQVNLAVINAVCDILGWDPSISFNIMDEYGYTGSACIPMAIDVANKKGELKKGDKIGICTSGGGAAFSAATLVWGK